MKRFFISIFMPFYLLFWILMALIAIALIPVNIAYEELRFKILGPRPLPIEKGDL